MSHSRKQAGFTILELMIATMVFSVILLLVTYGIIQIGNRYYKSVLQAQTQTATRNAVDEIARNIQFSSGSVVPNDTGVFIKGYCINGIQYTAYLHRMQGGSLAKHTLLARPDPGNNCQVPASNSHDFTDNTVTANRDLLGNRMRVVKFAVEPVPGQTGVFKITLRVASGDDDLLCSPSANDCNDSGTSTHLDNTDLVCKLQKGSAYCAVSELTTYVTSRLAP